MIFEAEQDLDAAGEEISFISLHNELARAEKLEAAGGVAFLSTLGKDVHRLANVDLPARIVREHAARRRVIHWAEAAKLTAFEGRDDAALIIERVTTDLAAVAAEVQSAGQSWENKFHTVEELPEGDVTMLIENVIPEGVTFLGASTGVGKSWTALSMSKALTSGRKFLGVWSVPQITPVIYLVPEMNGRAFKKRCERFKIGGAYFRCMTISDGTPCDLADPVLKTAVRDLKPVIFLDTAIRFSGADDENSASENAQGLARAIFALLHIGARAVICLHHRSKDAARAEEMTLENVLRGSGDLAAICDAVWGLQHDRGDGTAAYLKESKCLVRLQVRCCKARDFRPPEDFRIQLEPFIDQIHDLGVLTDEPATVHQDEVEILDKAIAANPRIEKAALEKLTGIGKNRQEKIAKERGWSFNRKTKWTRSQS